MKILPLILSSFALLMALAALVISLKEPEKQLEAAIDAGIARREKELVGKFSPKMNEVYEQMLGEGLEWNRDPETIPELLAPLGRIIGEMSAPLD